MNVRSICSHALAWLVVGSLTVVACDKADDKAGKADEKKADVKNDATALADTKADAKALDAKTDPPVEDPKADDAAAGDAAAGDEPSTAADDPADAGDDADDGDAKADDPKAHDPKARDPKASDPKKSDPKKKPDETKTAGGGSNIDAKAIFAAKCKSCHGVTGDAQTKIGQEQKIADWTQPGWKSKWPKDKVVDIVTNGKAGTKMKPFKEKLTAAEIDAVAEYSRKLGK